MSPLVLDPQAPLSTSAGSPMESTLPSQVVLGEEFPGGPSHPGTAARSLPPEDWQAGPGDPPLLGTCACTTAEEPPPDPTDPRAALLELRRLTGLTWEQLARLFGVSRRTLHFWASGKPINARNEEHLRRLLAVLRQADRGTASENRAMLLTGQAGNLPLDLLAERRYEAFLQLAGQGPGRRSIPKKPLSPEAREARKPPPPKERVDALQDKAHKEIGRGRPARTSRNKRRGPDR